LDLSVSFSDFWATIFPANGKMTQEWPANPFHQLPMDPKNGEQWSWNGHLVCGSCGCWICGQETWGKHRWKLSFSDFWATILPANGQMTQE
jgi:hypothetical protein